MLYIPKLTNLRATAILAVTITGVFGSLAQAQEVCLTANSQAGPFIIQGNAFERAVERLPGQVRQAEQKIRAAHQANGLVAGITTYSRHWVNCFPRSNGHVCQGFQKVCVSYAKKQDCPSHQYYSATARRCVTLH